jgi:hypothetical protein
MATYHVTAVPRPGEEPDPNFCPLSPCDVTADSEENAQAQAEGFMAHVENETWEWAYERSGCDADAARGEAAFLAQWQPAVRRVDRPSVAVNPRMLTSQAKHDGIVVGEHYKYQDPTGEQSFDVLIDGDVCGLLVGRVDGRREQAVGSEELMAMVEGRRNPPGNRTWFFAEAKGPLALVASRQWVEPSSGAFVEWPNVVLADIRAALETKSGMHGE